MTFFPPVLAQLPLLGATTWMTAAALLGFGAMMTASRSQGRAAVFWYATAGIAAFVCFAARQNSFPFVIVLCGIAASQWVRRGARRRTLAVGGVAIGLVVLLLVLLEGMYAVAGVDQSPRPQTHLYAYDLTAISVREHKVLLGARAFPSRKLSVLSAIWNPENVVTLVTNPAGGPPRSGRHSVWSQSCRGRALVRMARHVEEVPNGLPQGEKFTLRASARHRRGPAISDASRNRRKQVGASAFAHPQLNDAMRSYVALFSEDEGLTRGGLLFRPVIYVILLLLCISALLFQRRRTSYPALSSIVMWFMIAAVGYELTYLPLAIGTAYRFSYPVVVVAVVCAVWTTVATARDWGTAAAPSLAHAGTTRTGDSGYGCCSVVGRTAGRSLTRDV